VTSNDGKIPVVRRENNGGKRFATDALDSDLNAKKKK